MGSSVCQIPCFGFRVFADPVGHPFCLVFG